MERNYQENLIINCILNSYGEIMFNNQLLINLQFYLLRLTYV